MRRHPKSWLLPSCTAAALLVTLVIWPVPPDQEPVSPSHRAVDPETTGEVEAPAPSTAALEPVPELQRARTPVVEETADFAAWLERLVALALETSRHVERDDTEAAERSDREARRLFEEMLQTVPDADEQALFTLSGLLSEDVTLAGRARRRICLLTVTHGLERRHERLRVLAERDELDALVASVLAVLPQDEVLARDLGELLADRPFLGLAHEEEVLELLELSRGRRFLAPVAATLLTTLWRNLEDQGARTAGELAALALLYKDEPNAAKRLAAFRRLLTGTDPRFRQLAIDEVRRSGDAQLTRQLALVVAEELDGREALDVLRSLGAPPTDLLPALLALGHREGGVLVRAYEQHLADDVDPALRAELVSGAGFNRSPQGVELAKLAFHSDPDPDVRGRALFVLTAFAAEAMGETVMNAALDDPAFREDPARLGALVLALENLAHAGLENAVDRVGRRLRTCALQDVDRRALERILARSLPGGRTSTSR